MLVVVLVAAGCEPSAGVCRCTGDIAGVGAIDLECGSAACVSGVGLGCIGPNRVEIIPSACGMPGDDAGSTPDGGTGSDAGPPPATLYTVCQSDVECDEGLRCDTRFPRGVCTRDCALDADCGADGICTLDGCAPRCASGALECDRYGGACSSSSRGGFCVPTCGTRRAEARCRTGLVCDPYTGDCTTTPVTTGDEIGEPCTTHEECRTGYCYMEIFAGRPTGFLDGTCAGRQRSMGLGVIAQSADCPDGSLVTNGNPEGDLTLCLAECSRDAQCRAGYYCFGAPGVGYCRPLLCATTMSTRRCPTGTSCEPVAGTGTSLCVRCVPSCTGRECGDDGCGGTCGTCAGLDRCSTAGVCECVGETAATLCSIAGANCGSLTTTDGCGVSRTVDCGTCAGTCGAVIPNRCCVPETDGALCTAASANCDTITVTDACGATRTPSCGTCTPPATCGAVTANRCGCVGETVTELCASHGATCGTLSVTDRCGVGRSVSCGSCVLPETCGGAGIPNTCGICVPSCGSRVCGNDGCGGSCGSCPSAERCNASGACELIPCDPVSSTLCTAPQKCDWTGAATACRPAGTGLAETPCVGSYDCAAEHTCSSDAMCREYCTTRSDCRGGALCAFDLTGSPYGLCSVPCDPTYEAARAGASGCSFHDCRILDTPRATEVTDCGPTGSRPTGSSCTSAAQCFGGDTCYMGACRHVCELGFACTGGTCRTVPGWSTYGVCL